jgi:Rrf2 family protein
MRMNQGVEWAIHACALLAPLWPDKGLSLAALAEFHGVPGPYMAKQMQLLSKAGLVRTSRGRSGGYALARAPVEINLWQIARAIDGPEPAFRCTEIRQQGPCATPRAECKQSCPIAAAFAGAEAAWRSALEAVTLVDIMVKVGGQASPEHLMKSMAWLGEQVVEIGGN